MKKIVILLISATMVLGSGLSAFACYGAEALGMGGAYTAMADGALAIYWNQAGLAFSDSDYEFSGTYTNPQNWLNYNSFTGTSVRYNNYMTLGYGVTSITGGEDWNTFAVGIKVSDNLAVGGAMRKVNWSALVYDSIEGTLGLVEELSTGLDLSAQYRTDHLRLGVLFQDFNGESVGNPYMKNVRPSIAYVNDKIALAFDIYSLNNAAYRDYQFGAELYVDDNVTLRGGVYQEKLTYGLGYNTGKYFCDVVFVPYWEIAQFTAGVRF